MTVQDAFISVIVLNYNGAHLLPDCLDSLHDQIGCRYEILVVDNASIDQSQEVTARYPNVRWIPLQENNGLGPGYNAGARESQGDYLFFVNNDMRFESDCLLKLLRAFSSSDIFAADPLEFDWSGKHIIHGAQTFRFPAFSSWGIPFIAPTQNCQASDKVEISWGCAGALMVEKSKFQLLGGFDPTFFLDYEDVDLCWRAWMRGWKSIFVPDAKLYHKVGESDDEKMKRNNPQAAEKSAPINFRRLVSQRKNAGRFILKVMPWHLVFYSGILLAAKLVLSLLLGKFLQARAYLRAAADNCRQWSDTLRERKRILSSSLYTSSALLKKWGTGKA